MLSPSCMCGSEAFKRGDEALLVVFLLLFPVSDPPVALVGFFNLVINKKPGYITP